MSDVRQPNDLAMTWLIARRGAVESLRDRMTVGFSTLWALGAPLFIVLVVIRPQAEEIGADAGLAVGGLLSAYLLVVGLMPSSGSIGVAAGLFAGEKDQGNLLPLLATPASNRAIFAGKVLGAVLPALVYAVVAETTYLLAISLFLGASTLRLLPLALSVAMVALVPAEAVLGAAVASLVSSRVRTYQSAQLLASLAVLPIMVAFFGLVLRMERWGPLLLLLAVASLIVLDLLLVVIGAATWQREEVMARR